MMMALSDREEEDRNRSYLLTQNRISGSERPLALNLKTCPHTLRCPEGPENFLEPADGGIMEPFLFCRFELERSSVVLNFAWPAVPSN